MSFANLRSVLAHLYSNEVSIRRIVDDSGLDASRIVFNASAEDNWHAILTKAEKIGRIEVLLDIVVQEYGSNQAFRNARDAYRLNHGPGQRLEMNDPTRSLQRQIDETEENLLLIEEQQAKYIYGTKISPQLLKEERQLKTRLDELYTHLKKLPDKSIPSNRRPGYLLPYRVDRSEQEDVLIEMLRQPNRRSGVPYVFFVHGDHLQCHDVYLERLCYESLPNCLGLDRDYQPIQKYHLRWPDFVDVNDLHKKLEQKLALCSPPLSPRQINEILTKTPVMICTHLCAEDWLHTQEAILGFLKFWKNWPTLNLDHPLLVFICIEYQMESPVKHDRDGFKQLIVKFRNKNAHAKKDANLLHEKITLMLDNMNPSEFHPLVYKALPRLGEIKRREVHEWARSELTLDFCRGHELFAEIREIFKEWEAQHFSQTMPMENLVDSLKKILDRYSNI